MFRTRVDVVKIEVHRSRRFLTFALLGVSLVSLAFWAFAPFSRSTDSSASPPLAEPVSAATASPTIASPTAGSPTARPVTRPSAVPLREVSDVAAIPPHRIPVPRLSAAYQEAGEALRRRECDRALARLGSDTPTGASERAEDASFVRVVQGLHAHACERLELARERLFLGGGPGTVLEDWRLLTLADTAAALDELPVARAALDKIAARYPSSPLFAAALEKAAAFAREAEDPRAVLQIVERAHLAGSVPGTAPIPDETLTRLDELAWEVAGELGDEATRRRVARRLLIRAPEKAEELAVTDLFGLAAGRTGGGEGTVAWASVLSVPELMERARALTGIDLHDEALEALEAVSAGRRDTSWRLLTASVLTRAHRGAEAFELLSDVEAADDEQASQLEWQRALAARDLASVHRGRTNLPAAERERWRTVSHRHLERVAVLDGDRELSRTALRRLFQDLADGELEPALRVLQRLQELDPEDATGADFLWRKGWEGFQDRNYSIAIGFWAELASLYPEHRNTRSGRYWTGRAYEALGHRERAREIYREIAAADTNDFYRKHALARLAPETRPDADGLRVPGREPAPWPEDPRLDRVRLLSDLGLDDLALVELEARRHRRLEGPPGTLFDPEGFDLRASYALESEIRSRKGDLRGSIGPIRMAFPALGGPYQGGVPERALRLYYPLAYEDTVRAQAELYDLPMHVLLGMIRQESGFDPTARSRAGARGLLQLMPATGREVARRIGLRFSSRRLADPDFNLRVGAAYFRQVMSMFDDHLELALAGYNGGPYRIQRLWQRAGRRDPDRFLEGLGVTESRIYVKRILVLSDSYRQLYDLAGPRRVAASRSRTSPLRPAAPAVTR